MRLLCLIRVRLSFFQFFFLERLQDNQSLLLDAQRHSEGAPIPLATSRQVLSLCQCNLLSHQNGKCGDHKLRRTLWIYAIAVGAREQKRPLKVQWGWVSYILKGCVQLYEQEGSLCVCVCVFQDCNNSPSHCGLREWFWSLVPLLTTNPIITIINFSY